MVAGGWQPASDELLLRNEQYGLDLTEQYFEVYIPGITRGMMVRVGRWIACPDIETQYAPDNYMASHSLLFTYDTYTQTGVMLSFMLNEQWMVQGAITAGTDMAPWYEGATPTGMFGVRWVSEDNKDSIYTCLNNINNAEFRHFDLAEGPAGHDNYNYLVSTWQHTFSEKVHTKTEGYFMWQNDAELGGTPSLGPVMPFGGGGGDGQLLPGMSYAYGVLNYTEFAISKKDFITVRNEWWKDERGMRSGYPGTYTSHAIGLTHNFNSVLQIRPEVGSLSQLDRAGLRPRHQAEPLAVRVRHDLPFLGKRVPTGGEMAAAGVRIRRADGGHQPGHHQKHRRIGRESRRLAVFQEHPGRRHRPTRTPRSHMASTTIVASPRFSGGNETLPAARA